MLQPKHLIRFEDALRGNDPAADLPVLAAALRDEGLPQIELYSLFERFYIAEPTDSPVYDHIADTMDLIYGGPWAKGRGLYPTELSSEKIDEHRKQA